MNLLGYCVSCLLVSLGEAIYWSVPQDLYVDGFQELGESLELLVDRITDTEGRMSGLAQQAMFQQFAFENRNRMDGWSGVKQSREQDDGPQNYYSNNHVSGTMMSAHSHSDFCRVIGMGEVVASLNGIEFQTRHNDYHLKMKDPSTTEYKKVIDIPYPDVPQKVLDLDNVTLQIEEMGKWFKAFKDQDHSVRDYRKYFKPVLCYMEGTWTTDGPGVITESFESDRHSLDAKSFRELHQKSRLAAYTGAKSRLENFAFLPTTIIDVDEKGQPIYAQFNYQILCHPLKDDLPLKHLHMLPDVSVMMKTGKSLEILNNSRAARYKIYEEDEDAANQKPQSKGEYFGLIDRLMYQIPGMDNKDTNLTETVFGDQMYTGDSTDSHSIPLNEAFYSRRYRHKNKGAMGIKHANRGFADQNLFVARNTRPEVAPMFTEKCEYKLVEWYGKMRYRKVCEQVPVRFSYAIPLEILYLTPIFNWNPYNITLHPNDSIPRADKRNGFRTDKLAFNGTWCKGYYRTPVEFFDGSRKHMSAEDTGSAVHVLDSSGVKRAVSSSGFRSFMMDAGGHGYMKFRYPVVPVYGEGSPVWKELNAVRDLLMNRVSSLNTITGQFWFRLERAANNQHDHEFGLTEAQITYLERGATTVNVTTNKNLDHVHQLELRLSGSEKNVLEWVHCDGGRRCDEHDHPKRIIAVDESTTDRLEDLRKMTNMMMMTDK